MDPLSLLATVQAAYSAIQSGISVAKELNEMAHDLSELMAGVGELTKFAADPPRGWTSKGSPEELALQAFTAREEARRLEREVRSKIVSVYGLNAWEGIQREIIRIRKEQIEAARIAAEKREEMIEIVMTILGTIFVVAGLSVFGWTLYQIISRM